MHPLTGTTINREFLSKGFKSSCYGGPLHTRRSTWRPSEAELEPSGCWARPGRVQLSLAPVPGSGYRPTLPSPLPLPPPTPLPTRNETCLTRPNAPVFLPPFIFPCAVLALLSSSFLSFSHSMFISAPPKPSQNYPPPPSPSLVYDCSPANHVPRHLFYSYNHRHLLSFSPSLSPSSPS